MTYEQLLAMARRAEGKTLETVTGKRFTVGIYLDCPFFTPESTGRGQSDGRAAAERFVARFNQIGSLRPGDDAGVTRNASYYVALILELGTSAGGGDPVRAGLSGGCSGRVLPAEPFRRRYGRRRRTPHLGRCGRGKRVPLLTATLTAAAMRRVPTPWTP